MPASSYELSLFLHRKGFHAETSYNYRHQIREEAKLALFRIQSQQKTHLVMQNSDYLKIETSFLGSEPWITSKRGVDDSTGYSSGK